MLITVTDAGSRWYQVMHAPGTLRCLSPTPHTWSMKWSPEQRWISDKALVESVLRDLDEAAQRWEALLAEAESTTYTVDMGDIHAVANSDGKLIELTLQPNVVSDYSHGELADRMNAAFAALHDEVQDDYRIRYGGGLR